MAGSNLKDFLQFAVLHNQQTHQVRHQRHPVALYRNGKAFSLARILLLLKSSSPCHNLQAEGRKDCLLEIALAGVVLLAGDHICRR
ncbi:unnamed protein product [Urochloa humidicola]